MDGDVSVIQELLGYLNNAMTTGHTDPSAVYSTILKTWPPVIRELGRNDSRRTGLILQFLSVSMFMTYDEVKHMFYQELYKELNKSLAESKVRILNENASADDPTTAEVKYKDGSIERLLELIREGRHGHSEPLHPSSNPIVIAKKDVKDKKHTHPDHTNELLRLNEKLQSDNKSLLRIIKEILDAVRRLEPRRDVPPLNSKGCGTVQHLQDIARPLNEYFSMGIPAPLYTTITDAPRAEFEPPVDDEGVADSFNYPGWSRAKRSRAATGYDDPVGPTASLFRTHGHHF